MCTFCPVQQKLQLWKTSIYIYTGILISRSDHRPPSSSPRSHKYALKMHYMVAVVLIFPAVQL